jgi:hypothetical protein
MIEITHGRKVSRHNPPDIVDQLLAVAMEARLDRIAAIDAVTDELVRRGLCRRRNDLSRASEWIRRRSSKPASGSTSGKK